MIKILDKSMDQIAKDLNISMDRYMHIAPYVDQMIIDYKENPVDVMKEIPLNLKGNERSFAIISMASYFIPLYHKMDEKERVEFTNLVSEGLKISRVSIISAYMKDILIKEIEKLSRQISSSVSKKENPLINVIGEIVNSKFTGVEKDYMMFEFVLISGTIW